MSSLSLDTNGLPQPGRELDAAVWGMLGHEVEWRWCVGVDGIYHDLDVEVEDYYQRTTEPLATRHKKMPCYRPSGSAFWVPIPEVSTSAALFQVMEAMSGWIFEFWEEEYRDGKRTLQVVIYEAPTPGDFIDTACVEVTVAIGDYSTREEAYAHAVCACVWKVLKGERDEICHRAQEHEKND